MEMHNKVIFTIPFFRDSPKAFVGEIVPNLQPMMCWKGTRIYGWGDIPYESEGIC